MKEAFKYYYEDIVVIRIEAKSGVSNQPIGEETFVGARNLVLSLTPVMKA